MEYTYKALPLLLKERCILICDGVEMNVITDDMSSNIILSQSDS